jgi:hypothetical protein
MASVANMARREPCGMTGTWWSSQTSKGSTGSFEKNDVVSGSSASAGLGESTSACAPSCAGCVGSATAATAAGCSLVRGNG